MTHLIVIGGGPAGVTAALRARELGANVALVERGNLGGTCTNDGCVPTRVLAKAARLVRDAEQFGEYGLDASVPELDFPALLTRTQHMIYQVHEKKQLLAHLEESGVTVHAGQGEARFLDPHTIAVGETLRLNADRFILCAGGHARRLPFPGAEMALTHSDVWSLKTLPKSVVIVGGAATGSQLASIFAAFGIASDAARSGAAPDADGGRAWSRRRCRAAFERAACEVITGIGGIDRIENGRSGVHASLQGSAIDWSRSKPKRSCWL